MANFFAVLKKYQPDLPSSIGTALQNYEVNENLQLLKTSQLRTPSIVMAISDTGIKNLAFFEKNLKNPSMCINLCKQIYKETLYLGYSGVYIDFQNTETDTFYSNLASLRPKNISLYLCLQKDRKVPAGAAAVFSIDPAAYFVREVNSLIEKYKNREIYLKTSPRCLIYELPDLKNAPYLLSFMEARNLQAKNKAVIFYDSLRDCDYFTLLSDAKGQICFTDSAESYKNHIKTAVFLGISGFFIDYGGLFELYQESPNRFFDDILA